MQAPSCRALLARQAGLSDQSIKIYSKGEKTLNLSEHFTLEELTQSQQAVRACIDNIPDEGIVKNLLATAQHLENVRVMLNGNPILISSGYRCQKLNTLIGSVRTSQHTQGLAVDFTCPEFGTPKRICQHLLDMGMQFDQMIWEGTWVHLSHSAPGEPLRNEVLTAVFKPGQKTSYVRGLALGDMA